MAEHFLLSSHHLPQQLAATVPLPGSSLVGYPNAKNQRKRLCVAVPAVGLTVYDVSLGDVWEAVGAG